MFEIYPRDTEARSLWDVKPSQASLYLYVGTQARLFYRIESYQGARMVSLVVRLSNHELALRNHFLANGSSLIKTLFRA